MAMSATNQCNVHVIFQWFPLSKIKYGACGLRRLCWVKFYVIIGSSPPSLPSGCQPTAFRPASRSAQPQSRHNAVPELCLLSSSIPLNLRIVWIATNSFFEFHFLHRLFRFLTRAFIFFEIWVQTVYSMHLINTIWSYLRILHNTS